MSATSSEPPVMPVGNYSDTVGFGAVMNLLRAGAATEIHPLDPLVWRDVKVVGQHTAEITWTFIDGSTQTLRVEVSRP